MLYCSVLRTKALRKNVDAQLPVKAARATRNEHILGQQKLIEQDKGFYFNVAEVRAIVQNMQKLKAAGKPTRSFRTRLVSWFYIDPSFLGKSKYKTLALPYHVVYFLELSHRVLLRPNLLKSIKEQQRKKREEEELDSFFDIKGLDATEDSLAIRCDLCQTLFPLTCCKRNSYARLTHLSQFVQKEHLDTCVAIKK